MPENTLKKCLMKIKKQKKKFTGESTNCNELPVYLTRHRLSMLTKSYMHTRRYYTNNEKHTSTQTLHLFLTILNKGHNNDVSQSEQCQNYPIGDAPPAQHKRKKEKKREREQVLNRNE